MGWLGDYMGAYHGLYTLGLVTTRERGHMIDDRELEPENAPYVLGMKIVQACTRKTLNFQKL